MSRNYFDSAHRRIINSLLRDAEDLLTDVQRLGLPQDTTIATLYSIAKLFTERAKEMENG